MKEIDNSKMNSFKENAQKWPRLGGFIIGLIGFSVAYWVWVSSLQKALAGAERISLPYNFAALVSFGFVGIILMIVPQKLKDASERLKAKEAGASDYFLIGILLVPGLIAFYVLKSKIESLGYKF